MAAVKTLAEEKKVETLEEADFAYQEEHRLQKVADGLYVPENFEDDHNYYADPEGKSRYYGTTTVLAVIAKPQLIPWASNTNTETIKAKAETQSRIDGEDIRYYLVTPELLEEARVAHTKKKEKAGELGTDIHAQLEKLIKFAISHDGKLEVYMIVEDTPQQVREFIQWAVVNNVKFLASEIRLYSEKLWVAGTADFICEIKGKLYIGDIKTSSSIYDEHFYQASAYAHMAREMHKNRTSYATEGFWARPDMNFHGVVIVNIPRHGGIKVQESYDLKGNFNIFKAAVTIFKGKEARKVKKLKK